MVGWFTESANGAAVRDWVEGGGTFMLEKENPDVTHVFSVNDDRDAVDVRELQQKGLHVFSQDWITQSIDQGKLQDIAVYVLPFMPLPIEGGGEENASIGEGEDEQLEGAGEQARAERSEEEQEKEKEVVSLIGTRRRGRPKGSKNGSKRSRAAKVRTEKASAAPSPKRRNTSASAAPTRTPRPRGRPRKTKKGAKQSEVVRSAVKATAKRIATRRSTRL